TLTISGTTGTFADKHAGAGKTVTLANSTYGGADVSNYDFTDQAATTADITPKSVSVSGLVAQDRVYDATSDAAVDHSAATFNGIVAGDDLSASGTTGLFANKHIGTAKSVTLSGTTYGGTDVGNYVIADQTASTADITPFSVVIAGITADDKVYDSQTTATLSGTATANTFAGDDVLLETHFIANFASADAADGQSVSVSGFALSGSDANNYSLGQPTGLTADITPAALTIKANNDSKFVTKSDAAGYAGATYNGFVGSEGIGDLTGSLSITRLGNDEAAGTFASVLNASGLTSSNYDITFVAGDYTIVPAEQFLIRFGNSNSTYGNALGYSFLSAEYMDAGFNVATLMPTVSGNDYSFDDGVGGTAQFTIGLDGAALSSSGHANVGAYDLAMSDLIASGGNFSNDINLFGTHTIDRANLTVNAAGLSKTYDGTASLNNLTLSLGGLVAGDFVDIAGQGSYADRNAGTGLSYSIANLTHSGTDANNYALPGGTMLNGTDGVITSKNVTINAPSVTKVYDGNAGFSATTDQLNDWTTALGITGDTVDGITLTFGDKNVGTGKTLTPSAIAINDGNGGANYDVTFTNNNASSITRLNSVTWIGGATGDWNDPANWAGGAVPDLANVANVIIPFGVTPTFGTNVAGPVELDSFSGGNLQVDGGTLDVTGNVSADTLTQNGGTINAGDLNVDDLAQNAGNLDVSGDLTVNQSFTQSTTATIGVDGHADITHNNGTLTVNHLSSGSIELDATNGGVQLGNVESDDKLEINAAGDVTQSPTGTLTVGGTTSIDATGNVTLDGPNNDFVGTVNVDANDVEITDSNGGITLGTVTTDGTLEITTIGGDISQTESSQVIVASETTLTADGDIDLSAGNNQFLGPVNLDSVNAEITQTTGGLVLGTVDIDQEFWVDAKNGGLNQTTTGSIAVGGTTTLNARKPITLDNINNDFQDTLTVNTPLFNIQSSTPLDIVRTGASLADEVGAQANSQTVNDSLVRPATPTTSLTGWYYRVVEFLSSLVNLPNNPTAHSATTAADIQESDGETFVRPKQKQ
ncbi:MAG: YDG domain-containing protein, partial [Rubripirellula sp.]